MSHRPITAPFAMSIGVEELSPVAGSSALEYKYCPIEKIQNEAHLLDSAILGVIDHLSGLLATAHYGYEIVLPTLNLHASFFDGSAAPGSGLVIRLEVMGKKSHLCVISCNCRNETGDLVANAVVTFSESSMPLGPALLGDTDADDPVLSHSHELYEMSSTTDANQQILHYSDDWVGNSQHRMFHGGYLAGAVAYAAEGLIEGSGEYKFDLSDTKVHYLSPVKGTDARIVSKIVRSGKRFVLVESRVFQGDSEQPSVLQSCTFSMR